MSKEPTVDDKMRQMALRQLRLRVYYPQLLLRGGLAIFGLLLVWNGISGFFQAGPDLVTFYLTHVMAFLSLVVGFVLFVVAAFLTRRTYRALKNNAQKDMEKANFEASTWAR